MTKQQQTHRRRALHGTHTLHLPMTAPAAARLRRALYRSGARRESVDKLMAHLANPYIMMCDIVFSCRLVHALRQHHIVRALCFRMPHDKLTIKAYSNKAVFNVA